MLLKITLNFLANHVLEHELIEPYDNMNDIFPLENQIFSFVFYSIYMLNDIVPYTLTSGINKKQPYHYLGLLNILYITFLYLLQNEFYFYHHHIFYLEIGKM